MKIDPSPMLPDELREALNILGWTQAELARTLGISEGTMSGWINGTYPCRGPASAMIRTIIKELACASSAEDAQ